MRGAATGRGRHVWALGVTAAVAMAGGLCASPAGAAAGPTRVATSTRTAVLPDAPVGLHVTAMAGDEITAVWSPPANMGSGAFVRYEGSVVDPVLGYSVGQCATTTLSCTFDGLDMMDFAVTIRTVTSAGTSAPSSPPVVVTRTGYLPTTDDGTAAVEDSSRHPVDIDGDGFDDILMFRDFGGTAALWTMTNGPAGFAPPVQRWSGPWGTGQTFVTTGDFDGDNAPDVALLLSRTSGSVELLTMTGTGDGGFNPPGYRWRGDSWGPGTRALCVGDFNADGRDDLALFYDYGGDRVGLFTMLATGGGWFGTPELRWGSTQWGTGTRFVAVGQYLSDGRDHIALFYQYPGNRVGVFVITSTASGPFGAPTLVWGGGAWGTGTTRMAAYAAQGGIYRVDRLILLYDYGAGRVGIFSLSLQPGQSASGPTRCWNGLHWDSGPPTLVAGQFRERTGQQQPMDDIAMTVEGNGDSVTVAVMRHLWLITGSFLPPSPVWAGVCGPDGCLRQQAP